MFHSTRACKWPKGLGFYRRQAGWWPEGPLGPHCIGVPCLKGPGSLELKGGQMSGKHPRASDRALGYDMEGRLVTGRKPRLQQVQEGSWPKGKAFGSPNVGGPVASSQKSPSAPGWDARWWKSPHFPRTQRLVTRKFRPGKNKNKQKCMCGNS